MAPKAKKRVTVCRGPWTFDVARTHWTRTRAGTPLGDETMAILDCLERIAVVRGWLIAPVAQAVE